MPARKGAPRKAAKTKIAPSTRPVVPKRSVPGPIHSVAVECLTLDAVAERWGTSVDALGPLIRDGKLHPVVWFETSPSLWHCTIRGRGVSWPIWGGYFLLAPPPWDVFTGPRKQVTVAPMLFDGAPPPWVMELSLGGPVTRKNLRILRSEVERHEREHPQVVGTAAAKPPRRAAGATPRATWGREGGRQRGGAFEPAKLKANTLAAEIWGKKPRMSRAAVARTVRHELETWQQQEENQWCAIPARTTLTKKPGWLPAKPPKIAATEPK